MSEGRKGLTDRLREWSRSETPKPVKVTAQEILDRGTDREERRPDGARQGQPVGVLARRVLAGGLALGALGFFAAGALEESAHTEQVRVLAAERGKVQGEVSDAKVAAQAGEVDPVKAAASIKGAEEAAADVARLQNAYHGIELSTEVVDGVGVVVGGEEYKAVNTALRAHFTDEARAKGLDPATQWFQMWTKPEGADAVSDWVLATGDAYAWTAPQVWSIVDGNTVRVVWQLHETATGELLAWATGDFHADTTKFDNIVLGTTSAGSKRVPPSDSTQAEDAGGAQPGEFPTRPGDGGVIPMPPRPETPPVVTDDIAPRTEG